MIVTALALHTGDHVGAGKIHLQPLTNSSFYLALGAPRAAGRLLAQPVSVSEFVSVTVRLFVLMNFNGGEGEEGASRSVDTRNQSQYRAYILQERIRRMNINICPATYSIFSFVLAEIYLFYPILFFFLLSVEQESWFYSNSILDFFLWQMCVTIIYWRISVRFVYSLICKHKYLSPVIFVFL